MTNLNPETPDDMTELYDARIDRVDLVGNAANGTRFLLAKSANGLIPADMVRQLITKESPAMAEENTAPAEAELAKTSVDVDQQPETDVVAKAEEAEAPAAEVAKADDEAPEAEDGGEAGKKAMLPVYDLAGRLVGVVDADLITPVMGAGTTDEDGDGDSVIDTDGDGDGAVSDAEPEAAVEPEAPVAEAAAAVAPVEEAAAEDAPPTLTDADGSTQIDTDAAPTDGDDEDDEEDSRVIPGTNTVQSPVTKTAAETDLAAVLKEYLAPLAEQIAKAADLAGTVAVLEERIEKFGAMPDNRAIPAFNGATGANAGLSPRDGASVDGLEPLRKALAQAQEAGDPARIQTAKTALLAESVKARFQQ